MASPLVGSLLYIIHTLVLLFYRVHNLSVKDWLQLVLTGFIPVFKCFQSKLTGNRTAVSVTYYFQNLGPDQSIDHGSVQFGPRFSQLDLKTLSETVGRSGDKGG
jgi:hypothetical protein